MNSEPPFSGDVPDGGDGAPYEWLDEWLCEYVDGTMDPSLEAVFEQYVNANPDLKAHVERLKETRSLLSECGLSPDSSPDRETRIGGETSRPPAREPDESSPPSFFAVLRARPWTAVGLVASVGVALLVGFLAGATLSGSHASLRPLHGSSPVLDARPGEAATPRPERVPSFTPAPSRPSLLPSPAYPPPDSAQRPSSLTTIGEP